MKSAPQFQNVVEQWRESHKALQEAEKSAQQFQDVVKQGLESQKAIREAVAASQKYVSAIVNARKIAVMSGAADEERQ
jgi:hypothetical protein